MVMRNGGKMKFCMSLVFTLILWVQPLAALQPAYDSLPPELVRLRDEGRLTVRALWAWNLVPQSTAGMALEFRALGLDLIGANREQLTEWARQAEAGELQLTAGQRNMIALLIGWMNSGHDGAQGETAQGGAAVAESPADEIAWTDSAAGESDSPAFVQEGHSEMPAPTLSEAASADESGEAAIVEAVQELASVEVSETVEPPQAIPAVTPATQEAAPISEADEGMAMYRGGAERTGVSTWPGPSQQPALLWKLKVGDGPCRTPVVFDGGAYIGSVDGHLYAIDMASGALKWKFWAEDWVDQPPAVFAGTVFFGNVMGDKSGDRHLFAVDAATGSEKWRFNSLYYSVDSSPAIVDGTVYFGAGDHHLYALDARTGENKWSFKAEDSVGTPAIVGGTVFFAHGNRLTAVDLGSDVEKWTFRTPANITTCPAVSDGLVCFGSDDFHIYAVDTQTGQEKWKFHVGLIHYPPAVHDGVVYAVSFDNLHAIDAGTGTEKWTVNTGRESLKAPVISGDTLYLGAGRFLLALDRVTGQEKWRFEAGDEITTPAISDGAIYFWSEDGHFYAVR